MREDMGTNAMAELSITRTIPDDINYLGKIMKQAANINIGAWNERSVHRVESSLTSVINMKNYRLYTIRSKERIIGLITFRNIDYWNKNAEIGITLAQQFCNKGVVSSLLPEIKHISFNVLRLHKIYGFTLLRNTAARRVSQKFGGEVEGIIENYGVINGKWEDVAIVGLLNK